MQRTVISVFDLSPSEKLQLVQDLWDDLVSTPDVIPLTEAQLLELNSRKEKLVRNPGSALNWEEVKRRARAKHGR